MKKWHRLKPPNVKPEEWGYRNKVVKLFKQEIDSLLRQGLRLTISTIPSSKMKDHPEYTNRFEDLFKELKKTNRHLLIEWPVRVKQNKESLKLDGIRAPNIIKENYVWEGFKTATPRILYIFDDILTSGASFRAMSDFLKENSYNGKIIGIFWARTVKS